MNIAVYSDESGVFDRIHHRYYVYGGLIFLSDDEKQLCSRKYIHAENIIRKIEGIAFDEEVKASVISNSSKSKLYRSLNQFIKFGVIIDQSRVLDRIFLGKKDKQRYLDYVYKISVKRALENLVNNKKIVKSRVESIDFFVDEHSTATNGRYELREALEQELKSGTYNLTYDRFFEPLFPDMRSVNLHYCNSKKKTLIRASDIVANHIYYLAKSSNTDAIPDMRNLHVVFMP